MPKLLLLCKKCHRIFPSGIFMGPGSSATFVGNKSKCPFCKSWENIPDGTFKATVNGFIEILKSSKNPLQDAKDILDGLEKAKDTQDLSKVLYGDKIELFLKKNKLKIAIGIAILKILVDLLTKQPNIEINNSIINQQFYNQYNQVIDIDIDKK